MMPFVSECCKGSKLLVDLFLESYTRCTTHNGILNKCNVAIIQGRSQDYIKGGSEFSRSLLSTDIH